MLTSDRYIIDKIHKGTALVVHSGGLVVPCEWHKKHARLESVAINRDVGPKVAAMYSLTDEVKQLCEKHGLTPMTEEEVKNKVKHI